MDGPYAFVTLVSSDSYLPGALAQAAALKDVHPDPPVPPEVPFKLVCLVTPESVDVTTIKLLRRAFDLVVGVEILEQQNNQKLKLLGRPDLTTVLTKLHVFRLTQFSKIVFLDADVLPIQPLSHLFSLEHEFAAVPDVGWPDIFNSGVLVLTPGNDKFHELQNLLELKGSWDGGDQGILNEWRDGNWHRLSFTYNTTPTGAYMYAPAYERYGSKIRAIHFIGPNKPWNTLQYRSPFTSQNKDISTPIQQTYDYDSLVDHWFAVYDKCYRSQPISPFDFEIKRYPSAWDNSAAAASPRGNVLGLEDLRKIALEGFNASGWGLSEARPGEGEYRSLPLEGRFDLMRPKKEQDDTVETPEQPERSSISEPPFENEFYVTDLDLPMTPFFRHPRLPDDPPRLHTLPTPGPDDLPPSPKIPLKSLPPTPAPASDYYASSAGQSSDEEDWKSDGSRGGVPGQMGKQTYRQRPVPDSPNQYHSAKASYTFDYHRPSQGTAGTYQATEYVSHSYHAGDQSFPLPLKQPGSPAVESPLKDNPVISNFAVDTYFSNVWGVTRSRKSSFTLKGSPEHPATFARVSPPLLRTKGESASRPDDSKVKPVFPWEKIPRQPPGRVFPPTDPSVPVLPANSEGSQAPTVITPSASGTMSMQPNTTLSPPPILSGHFNYSNAWDNVPSIKDYASRLAQPLESSPAANASSKDGHSQSQDKSESWGDSSEDSHDGDDEDEGVESDVDTEGNNSDDGDEDDNEDDKSRRRSHSISSIISDTHATQQQLGQKYRTQAVQTPSRETRSQGVQVSILTDRHDKSRSTSLTGKVASPGLGGTNSLASTSNRDRTGRQDNAQSRPLKLSMPPASSTPRASREFLVPATSGSSHAQNPSSRPTSSGIVPPPKLGISNGSLPSRKAPTPPKIPSPPLRPSVQTQRSATQPGKIPSLISRRVSNESSIASPLSSIGPMTPVDDQPIAPLMGRGVRVWDPARGVELFKRDSEEVLARFLRMRSWDGNNE